MATLSPHIFENATEWYSNSLKCHKMVPGYLKTVPDATRALLLDHGLPEINMPKKGQIQSARRIVLYGKLVSECSMVKSYP